MDDIKFVKVPLPEIILQHSWNSIPPKTNFLSMNGDSIIVHFPGRWNFEEGPDFRSAKISIGNNILIGDIEIHRFPADWIKHGHNKDDRYSNVILHVVGATDKTGFMKNDKLPPIPAIILPQKFLLDHTYNKKQIYPYGYCASKFTKFSNKNLCDFFEDAGERRFFEKVSAITLDILKDGVEVSFLKYFFDSCGYKKNRLEFIELFYRFKEYDFETISLEDASAVLWGESGLLPDPGILDISPEMKIFTEGVWRRWWKMRKCTRNKISWHLSGVRPLNNPCRRVAAISIFISKFSAKPFATIFEEFNAISDISITWKKFKELVVCRDVLWDNYSEPGHVLNKSAAVLGDARALDIMVNVILPFIYAYSAIHSFGETKTKALAAWKVLPVCQSNIVLKICSHRWLIPHERALLVFKNSAAQQGAIFIHKRQCESGQMNCSNCPIYSVLNRRFSLK